MQSSRKPRWAVALLALLWAASLPGAGAQTRPGRGSGQRTAPPKGGRKPPPAGMTADQYNRQGDGFYKAEKWAEAAEAYRAAVRLAPDEPVYQKNLGAALVRLEQYAGAEVAYRAAIRLTPEDAFAHNEL